MNKTNAKRDDNQISNYCNEKNYSTTTLKKTTDIHD